MKTMDQLTKSNVPNGMICRHVHVDRTKTPQQMLDATGRYQYTDKKVVKKMPKGDGEEKDVYFFAVKRNIGDDDLVKEYELRGLKPDPYAQAQANMDDPDLAATNPNGTHWKDDDGKWCYIMFGEIDRIGRPRDEEDCVDVHSNIGDWEEYCWFGGVPK